MQIGFRRSACPFSDKIPHPGGEAAREEVGEWSV